MKNLLFIFLLLVGVYSCSDNDSNPMLEIEGNKELSMEQQGGKQAVYFKSNTNNIALIIDEAGTDWCMAEVLDTRVIVTTIYNPHEKARTANITVVAGQSTSIITVNQQGAGFIAMDDKLKISSGEASSQHASNEIEKSFDGDLTTFWHSEWSVNPPHTITYNLQDAEKLDYIMYYPRTPNGGNGNFGEVEIYVSTEATPAFTKVMTHNFGRSGSPAKVSLPASVSKPKAVKFIILSGTNNNASCAQMEFYSKGTGTVVPKDIPLGGNSFVTASEGSGGGSVSDAGFLSWKSTSTVFSTYFKINRSGDLRLYLKYRADGDGNVIETTFRGKKFETTLPAPKTRMDTIVLLGVLEKVDPGYAQVDIKGVTLKGTTFATVTNLLVSGSSTEGMNYVKEGFSYHFGRRGPSVHMNYTMPAGQTAEWFYNEVTVTEGNDLVGSYYMTNGFSQGYFGMQVNSATERRVLFSVWSPYETDDPSSIPEEDRVKLIRKGEGVTINDFGNEGSGGQSYLKYNWITGNTYKFLNRVRPIEGGYSEYTAYFYAPELGKWRLIAQWKRPKIQTYYTGMYSFLENFSPTMGHLTRKVYFKNQWAYTTAGQWVELTNAKFTADATARGGHRIDYKGGLENGGFFLQNCGFFNDFVAADTPFARTATGSQPNINWTELE